PSPLGEGTVRSKATETSPTTAQRVSTFANVGQSSFARAKSGTVDRKGDARALSLNPEIRSPGLFLDVVSSRNCATIVTTPLGRRGAEGRRRAHPFPLAKRGADVPTAGRS